MKKLLIRKTDRAIIIAIGFVAGLNLGVAVSCAFRSEWAEALTRLALFIWIMFCAYMNLENHLLKYQVNTLCDFVDKITNSCVDQPEDENQTHKNQQNS